MNNIKQENWRQIEGCSDYQVSNLGRIRSCRKKHNEWRLITPGLTNDGYECVNIRTDNGKRKTFSVHRLVAKAFVSGYSDGLQVNHKDENTRNNCASNLEWITQRENNIYGTAIERRMRTVVRRMVIQMTMNGEPIARYYGPCDAARAVGICHSGIYAACNGKQKKAGGYRWKWDEKRESDFPAKKTNLQKSYKFESLDGEEWRDVVGYEGLYKISSCGRIRSLKVAVNGGLMRPALANGCLAILLVKEGKKRGFTIASLVARSFVDGYRPGLWVHHKNGNQKDNNANNLEWLERTDKKIARGQSKSLYKFGINGKYVTEYNSVKEAAESVGLKNGKRIVDCCNGKRDIAHGYRWQWKS